MVDVILTVQMALEDAQTVLTELSAAGFVHSIAPCEMYACQRQKGAPTVSPPPAVAPLKDSDAPAIAAPATASSSGMILAPQDSAPVPIFGCDMCKRDRLPGEPPRAARIVMSGRL